MTHHPVHTTVRFIEGVPHRELAYVLQYGYLAFFLILFANEFSGFFPSGILMISMGALAHRGFFDAPLLLLYATVATVLGNLVMYSLARSVGMTEVYRKRISANRFAGWLERGMQARPFLTIFLSRFVGIVCVPSTLLAGLSRIPRVPFIIAVTLGNSICCALYLSIGYFVSATWEQDAVMASRILVGVALVGAVMYCLYYILNHKKSD